MALVPHGSTLVARAINELSTMILSGQFRAGDFLPPQRVLASQLGVGISTIREATQVLTNMGLIASRPGKGTWVREDAVMHAGYVGAVRFRLTELQALMVFETRLVLEVPMTEFAAERATADDIQAITHSLSTMESAVNDNRAFSQADVAFHLAIAKASQNDLLMQFYQLASELLAKVIEELDNLPGVKEEAMLAHRAVAEAICEHDVRRAREGAQEHLSRIGRLIRRFA